MSITDAQLNDLRGSRPNQTYDGEVHLTTEEFWAILARLDDAEGAVQHEVDRLRSANRVAHRLKSARDAAWEELRVENARLREALTIIETGTCQDIAAEVPMCTCCAIDSSVARAALALEARP